MRIAALSLGVGNIRSAVRALEHVVVPRHGSEAIVTATAEPELVRHADVIVVPGQGSFGAFAEAIDRRSGLRDVLVERIRSGTPYFGICLGLQILFEASDEAPGAHGLGVLQGRVHRLDPGTDPQTGTSRALPHIGWNLVEPRDDARNADKNIFARDHYYFAHSYAVPKTVDSSAATTEYGETFASAIRKDNMVGVQFHPEKSQRAGLALIERFFASLEKS